MHNNLTTWPSWLREYILTIVDRKKSLLAISQSQERFIRGKIKYVNKLSLLHSSCYPVVLSKIILKSKCLGIIFLSCPLYHFVEMPLLLSAITGVLVIHQSLGDTAIDLLAAIGIIDPKQGVPLLLAILFYSNIFTRKDTNYQNMLVSFHFFPCFILILIVTRLYLAFPLVLFIVILFISYSQNFWEYFHHLLHNLWWCPW